MNLQNLIKQFSNLNLSNFIPQNSQGNNANVENTKQSGSEMYPESFTTLDFNNSNSNNSNNSSSYNSDNNQK